MRIMKTLLVLVLCLVGPAIYRGWFSLSHQPCDGTDSKVPLSLTVDPDRVKADAEKVNAKTREIGHQATDTVKSIGK